VHVTATSRTPHVPFLITDFPKVRTYWELNPFFPAPRAREVVGLVCFLYSDNTGVDYWSILKDFSATGNHATHCHCRACAEKKRLAGRDSCNDIKICLTRTG